MTGAKDSVPRSSILKIDLSTQSRKESKGSKKRKTSTKEGYRHAIPTAK